MTDSPAAPVVQRAHEAAARGRWDDAYTLFAEAAAQDLLTPADVPLFADVAYASGHLDVTIATWERAHAALLAAGDGPAAAGAAVRVAMHLLFDTALMAPVRGWLGRAERLLDEGDTTPVHAWLAVVRSYERLLSGDLAAARTWAERALATGAAGDPAAAAIAGVATARLRILDGDVDAGLRLLDEAGVAAVSGGLDPLSTGVVYCELVCALQGLAYYDRAEEWTDAMERWSLTNAIGSLRGRCRVHRAEILRLRGDYDEAEREVLVACDELQPFVRRELGWPLTELGRIRLCRGDVRGAEEALRRAHSLGWEAQPGLALVWHRDGDTSAAADALRGALANPSFTPSKELPPCTELRRAPLLAAQVEIDLALGDTSPARDAADELGDIAARFKSTALRASAVLAWGRVALATGAIDEARRSLSEAVRLWTEVDAPYEASIARRALAEAHRASGNDRLADLELAAAMSASPAPPAAADGARAADHRLAHEGEYWSLSYRGATVRVRNTKGLRYLARLLAEPGREFHVLDLAAAESGGHVAAGDAGAVLDDSAKDAYRRRLLDIEDDIDEALAQGDDERAAQAGIERDLLVQELARAVGLGGRERRAGSGSERARAGVTRAVRQAIVRIAEHHESLGRHLDQTIRTGTYCSYAADPDARWMLDAGQ